MHRPKIKIFMETDCLIFINPEFEYRHSLFVRSKALGVRSKNPLRLVPAALTVLRIFPYYRAFSIRAFKRAFGTAPTI
jgi:hypothetical protein